MGIINQKSTPTGKTATVENRTIDAIVEDINELNEVVKTIENDLENVTSSEPLVYVAILTQSGTNNPVATVVRNDFGSPIVWTREFEGQYKGFLANKFPSGKTVVWNNGAGKDKFVDTTLDYGPSEVGIATSILNSLNTYDDGVMNPTTIKIEVYP